MGLCNVSGRTYRTANWPLAFAWEVGAEEKGPRAKLLQAGCQGLRLVQKSRVLEGRRMRERGEQAGELAPCRHETWRFDEETGAVHWR